MFGYKVFYKGLIDSFGNKHTIGTKYKLDGEVKWSQNGFHFCKRPEDTLRNFDDFNNKLEIIFKRYWLYKNKRKMFNWGESL